MPSVLLTGYATVETSEEARKKQIFDIQRYIAEQQYYVYTIAIVFTCTWQPYVKNYAPNLSFDYGGRTAALWLEH